LIGGQAGARELTLVTHDTNEFQRVPGLKVEDWKRSPTQRRKDSRDKGHDLHRRWRKDADCKEAYDALG
jgi:hypothetical protein